MMSSMSVLPFHRNDTFYNSPVLSRLIIHQLFRIGSCLFNKSPHLIIRHRLKSFGKTNVFLKLIDIVTPDNNSADRM